MYTPAETNITPDNGWLEDEISFWDAIFAERLPLVLGTMTCMSSIALRYFPTSSMDFIWMLSDWMMVLCPWKIRWVTNKTANLDYGKQVHDGTDFRAMAVIFVESAVL